MKVRHISERSVKVYTGRFTVTFIRRSVDEVTRWNVHRWEVRIRERRGDGYGTGYGMTRHEAMTEARDDLIHGPTPATDR